MGDDDAVAAGVGTRDPIPDISLQDETPTGDASTKPAATTGPALLKMFRAERETQGDIVRGPVKVPLVDPATGEPADAVVYYRRLTRADKARFKELADEATAANATNDDLNWLVFIERALDENGHRLLSGVTYETAREGNWNDDAVSEAVYEMSRGSRTILTDDDLGNSSTPTPPS